MLSSSGWEGVSMILAEVGTISDGTVTGDTAVAVAVAAVAGTVTAAVVATAVVVVIVLTVAVAAVVLGGNGRRNTCTTLDSSTPTSPSN